MGEKRRRPEWEGGGRRGRGSGEKEGDGEWEGGEWGQVGGSVRVRGWEGGWWSVPELSK